MDSLKQAVKTGAEATLRAFREAHPQEVLAGYAFCTDDDLGTLSAMFATKEFLDRSNEHMPFVPVDWPLSDATDSLDDANSLLMQASLDQPNGYEAHVRTSFACLVEVLQELKEAGTFDGGVVLQVTSTDPGPLLRELADEAIFLLNNKATQDAWRRTMNWKPA